MAETTTGAHAAQVAEHTIEAAVIAHGPKVGIAGATASIGGWLTLNDMVAIVGIVAGVGGLLVPLVLGIRKDRREERESKAREARAEAEHIARMGEIEQARTERGY
jgi:hypothetical protein